MQTARHQRIHHGAFVNFVGNVCTLRLNASYRYKTEVAGSYDSRKREVEVQKVAEHRGLYTYRK
ncbi:hypothetical protein HYR99_13080 [Candidatus Poribacteria bacterium]|nr:hypothetical protein [Candidatus Poribacteria bacterium]